MCEKLSNMFDIRGSRIKNSWAQYWDTGESHKQDYGPSQGLLTSNEKKSFSAQKFYCAKDGAVGLQERGNFRENSYGVAYELPHKKILIPVTATYGTLITVFLSLFETPY